jgi:hypothetical protein
LDVANPACSAIRDTSPIGQIFNTFGSRSVQFTQERSRRKTYAEYIPSDCTQLRDAEGSLGGHAIDESNKDMASHDRPFVSRDSLNRQDPTKQRRGVR